MAGSTTTVCRYFQTGFCKFKSECRNVHINDICMKIECSDKSCIKRHQRKCKYFFTYGYCKFANNCAYLHTNRAQEEKEIKLLRDEIRMLKIEISKILEILNNREALVKIDSRTVSDIPQLDGNDDNFNDYSTVNDDVELRECISTSLQPAAIVLSPPALPPDDGTCVSCYAEYSGWDDFITRMKKSNYMCFGCFDFFPDQPWFKRSLLVEVDAQCGSYLYLKQH